jgi:hypothetical protein
MDEIDRPRCRKAAAECIELARTTSDPDTKQILLTRAQEWLKLAYSEHDAGFVELLGEFNKQQMSYRKKRRRPPPPRAEPQQQEMQQQEMQQQQSKAEPKDEP